MADASPHDDPVRPSVLLLAVAVLSVLPYVLALDGGWIFDDHYLIENNRYVHSFEHWRRWISRDFWDLDSFAAQAGDRLSYWRPLVLSSYALDFTLSGGNPVGFHVTNGLWHALASVLAYSALSRWTRSLPAAFLGALIFAWHPTKAESVAWIAGRTDVLVTTGLFLACLGVARRLRQQPGGRWLEALGAVVAFGSKEQAIVIPILAGVEAWAFLGRPALGPRLLSPWTSEGRQMLRVVAPYVAFVAVYLAGRAVWLPMRTFEITGLPFAKHAGFVLEAFGRYFVLTLWPQDLSVSRALLESNAEGVIVQARYAIAGALGLAGLLGGAWALRSRAPAVSAGALVYALTLLPVVNVMWSGFNTLVSPRFLYLPLIGTALAVADLLALLERGRARRWAFAVISTVAIALGTRSVLRSAQFGSEDLFWRYELEHKPWSPTALLYEIERLRGRHQDQLALRLCQRGHALALRHTPHTADAARFVRKATDILAAVTPDSDVRTLAALSAFGRAIVDGAPDPARLRTGRISLEVLPSSKASRAMRRNPAELFALVSEIELRLGNDGRALSYAERAVTACGRCPNVLRSAVRSALGHGRFDLAERWLGKLEHLSPGPRVAQDRRRAERVEALSRRASQATGSARLAITAQRLAVLGLWGRATALLLPHEAEITGSGLDSAATLASLAFRAGNEAAARRVLGVHLGPQDVERQLERWRRVERQIEPWAPGVERRSQGEVTAKTHL